MEETQDAWLDQYWENPENQKILSTNRRAWDRPDAASNHEFATFAAKFPTAPKSPLSIGAMT
jgi:hypothetical protein